MKQIGLPRNQMYNQPRAPLHNLQLCNDCAHKHPSSHHMRTPEIGWRWCLLPRSRLLSMAHKAGVGRCAASRLLYSWILLDVWWHHHDEHARDHCASVMSAFGSIYPLLYMGNGGRVISLLTLKHLVRLVGDEWARLFFLRNKWVRDGCASYSTNDFNAEINNLYGKKETQSFDWLAVSII